MSKLVFAFLILVAVASAQTPAGKELYMKYNCYACHGFSGQNGSGARLVPMKLTQDGFTSVVRKGRGGMPHYSAKVLPDAQLGDIYGYIKTLPDLTPSAKSIPALNGILSEK